MSIVECKPTSAPTPSVAHHNTNCYGYGYETPTVRCLLAHFTHQDRYKSSELLSHLQDCVNALSEEFTDASVALAGDFNSLDNDDVVSYCVMSAIVNQPTRGNNVLDRIYVSGLDYESVQVVTSLVKSDHRAAIAYTRLQKHDVNKRTERRRTPAQHASFLHASQLKISLDLS